MDEEGHTSPTPLSTAKIVEGVAGDVDVDVGERPELSLLDGGDGDAMLVEEFPKFVDFPQDTVTVPLENGWTRRWNGARARVWMNPSGDEEACEEDEEAEGDARRERSAAGYWPNPPRRRKPDEGLGLSKPEILAGTACRL